MMKQATRMMFLRNIIISITLIFLACCAYILRPSTKDRETTVVMEVTAYCPCGECCGWHRTWLGIPVYNDGLLKGKRKRTGITADETRAKKGTIAADISRYPFGTNMYVAGYGWGVVHDTGSDIKGDHIDIFFPQHQQVLNWGRKQLQVKVIR